jgi:Lipid A 3-O-deacylase (PagL)
MASMGVMRAVLFILLLALSPLGTAAEPQGIAAFGRATESQETDIVRLAYRHPLPNSEAWWRPTHVQLGGSIWQVPDIRGSTRRLDLNATAIWRNERPWGYLEAGFGGYLLSKTINNPETRVPSAFEFGSHIGIGFALAKDHAVGLALQHLSNAGLKQPNGGIDLVLVQYTFTHRD